MRVWTDHGAGARKAVLSDAARLGTQVRGVHPGVDSRIVLTYLTRYMP